ncbi:glycosyltransferase family 4 protein [Nocardia terpenica]
MNIVLVAPPYFEVPPSGYGGVETVVAHIANALVGRGHRVTLLGAGRPGTRARFVPVFDHTLAGVLGEPFPEILYALKVRDAVTRIAAAERVDIVHDHTFAGPLNAPAYAALGATTVVTVHGPVDGELGDYYRALDHTDTAHLIAISDRQRRLAPDLDWVARVHNAIDPGDWPMVTRKQDWALFLGRYAPTKGAHLALDAAHTAGLPLVLAAKRNEPPEHHYFGTEIVPRLTGTDIIFGEADAVAKRLLLSHARCLLFPICWEEPFGLVMIEAMACGTPVVALRGGAVDEVIDHGVTGLICDHPDELPDALHAVRAIDPGQCRRRVEKLFSIDRLGSDYETTFHRLLAYRRISLGAIGRINGAPTWDLPERN